MEERLRSILRRIHWSSLLKAAIFAAVWLWLPFWVFVLVAFYLYFIPWFKPGRLAFPFLALVVLAFLEAQSFPFALIFGAIFYCILLVRDLLVLDRRSVYEVIVLALAFFFLRGFYQFFNEGIGGSTGSGGAALFYAFLVAAVIAALLRSFLGAFPEDASLTASAPEAAGEKARTAGVPRTGRRIRNAAAWLSFLLFAQIGIVCLFLPLDFTYQAIAAFLVVVLFIDLVAEYIFAGLSRNKMLGVSSTVFILLAIVLSSARWGL